MGEKSGSGIWDPDPDHISASLETIFGLKYLSFLMGIRDGKIRIRDKRPGSATLDLTVLFPS
jgi:hypothetical protein